MTAPASPPAPARTGRTLAAGQAVRQAGRFDRARISARAGLIAAIPVAAMLALGTALGSPAAAVTMGVGAMLSGVAWRAGDGPIEPPVTTMAGASLAFATATLAGTLSGNVPWLHLVCLIVFCLVGGSGTALGRPGTVIGSQSIVAFLVFGRFPENLPDALGLAGLVTAGGAVQTLFAALVGAPLAWRRQRAALAAAYRQLAVLTDELLPSAIPSAAALDVADQALSGPALFADPQRTALAGLVRAGRRIRLELIVLASMAARVRRTAPELATASEAEIGEAVRRVRNLLELVVIAVTGNAAARSELAGDAEALSEWGAKRAPLASQPLDDRLAALIGQAAAAARLAAALRVPEGSLSVLVTGRPTLGLRRLPRGIRYGARRMWAGARLDNPAGRHALRLAVVVPLMELVAQLLGLPRGYWAAVAAATVLRPDFSATFTRGAERMLGTLAGVVVASAIALAIDPSGWGVVAVVGVLAFVTYAVFPASFAVGVAMLTGVVVFLLHAVAADSGQIALDRGLDTAIGGVVGLVAYALWPTWSAIAAGPLLARLVETQNLYLDAVLGGLVSGRHPPDATLRPLARDARVAFADASAAIGLARSEPAHGDVDPQQAGVTLSALRRIVWSVHALRLDLATSPGLAPLPPLQPLRHGFAVALDVLSATLREVDHGDFPRLRGLHRELGRDRPDALPAVLWAQLDELVDATDAAATTVGLTLP